MAPKQHDQGRHTFKPQIFDFPRLFHEGADPDKLPWGFPKGSSILISGPPGSGKSSFALAVARGILLAEAWSLIRKNSFGKTKESSEIKEIDLTPQPLQAADISRTPFLIYYVSTEVDEARLARIFDSTGWFQKGEFIDGGDLLFSGSQSRFRPINSRVDTARPVRSSEELINELTFKLRKDYSRIIGDINAIVIIDSLTALLRDCHDRGEERRQTHEFVQRLQTALGPVGPALTFFISEESASAPQRGTVPAEEYVVDFVFRLKLKDTGMGRRLRAIETVKSHGALLRLGEHTWSIVTRQTIDGVITSPELQHHIEGLATNYRYLNCDDQPKPTGAVDRWRLPLRNNWRPLSLSICDVPNLREFLEKLKQLDELKQLEGKPVKGLEKLIEYKSDAPVWPLFEEGNLWPTVSDLYCQGRLDEGLNRLVKPINWGTVTLYPAPALPKIGRRSRNAAQGEGATTVDKLVKSGVTGLDAMLNFSKGQDYWTQKELEPDAHVEEEPGLVPGTMSVVVGPAGSGKTNMCLQFLLDREKREGGHGDGGLYINFELPFEEVRGRYPDSKGRKELEQVVHIFRRRGNLDINALLAETRFLVMERDVRRVVIDGLSSLLATTNPADYSRLIESLLATIQDVSMQLVEERKGQPITTLCFLDVFSGISSMG